MTHENSPEAYHVHDTPGGEARTPQEGALVEARAIREFILGNVVQGTASQEASALAALDSLLARLEAAERERDEARATALITATAETQKMWREQKERAEAAERENERLREALAVVWGQLAHQMDASLAEEVRAALARTEAPR